jgi:hypothetical protein
VKARGLLLAAIALATISSSCGREVPAGGEHRPAEGPRVARRLEPLDLLPGDLDLVVRVDVARMRAGLGIETVERLAAEAAPPAPGEELLVDALQRAEVVWVGMRVSDGMLGDRVVVVEGRLKGLEPDEARWRREPSPNAEVRVWDRVAAPPRAGTARIITSGERMIAFVTPIEVASVARVLANGPDDKRGDPAAVGLLSFDLRARRFTPNLERKFPSIGGLVAGLDRVRGSVTLDDSGLRLEADVAARSPAAAQRALTFLQAVRDNVRDPARADLLALAKVEQVGKVVRVRWSVPAKSILMLTSQPEREP